MAEIVTAFLMPHDPLIAAEPDAAVPRQREAVMSAFAHIAKRLSEERIDTVITIGDDHYWAEYSYVAWPLPPGTPIYAQVDSAGEGAYGGVLEAHEIRGEPYNTIAGPVYSVPGRGRAAPAADAPAFGLHLPPR